MSFAPSVARSPLAPVLGAALVVAAVGGLVWALVRLEPPRAAGADAAVDVRGAPIRSAVAARAPDAGTDEPAAPAPGGYEEVDFAELSGFDYPKSGSMQVAPPSGTAESTSPAPSDARVPPSKIPESVRALDGQRVTITGFMNPIEFDQDGVKSFALTAIPGGCCYGAIPRLNEWIVVTMPEGELAEYAYYDPVTLFGELSVGEIYADGVVLSLYRMTPTKVDVGY